jgi:Cytochrome c7 and related cytochrome c
VYRLVLLLLVGGAAAAVIGPMTYVRTPYNTNQFETYDQPVEFDHRHHVRDDGIQCVYCHSSVERSPNAGVPTTGVCMGCHTQIWNDSPLLEIVRRSYFSGRPINWKRVHDLPDFVYFDHSVHIARGVPCKRCHGEVEQMPHTMQVQPLTMNWCVDCHRNPDAGIADLSVPTNMLEATGRNFFKRVVTDRDVTSLTTCSACHR